MMHETQLKNALMQQAADAFLARLDERVAEGHKTESEGKNMHDRLLRGLELATTGRLEETEPGVWRAWSTGKNGHLSYSVSGRGCSCPDADLESGGKAHAGWCKHRAAIYLTLAAHKGLEALTNRLEGLRIPHTHTWGCGHEAAERSCYDPQCAETLLTTPCLLCEEPAVMTIPAPPHQEPETTNHEPETRNQEPPSLPAEGEAKPYTPKPDPLPEAGASVNLKCKKGAIEIMVTMRAHTDAEILARLPAMLKGLEAQLGVSFTNK